MLGGSGGKYWAAARTPLPPTPPPSPQECALGSLVVLNSPGFSVASPVTSLTPVAAHAYA